MIMEGLEGGSTINLIESMKPSELSMFKILDEKLQIFVPRKSIIVINNPSECVGVIHEGDYI